MTDQRSHVPVDVVKRKKAFNSLCTLYTCFVVEDGTLADLRSTLEGDQIMVATDRFHADGKDLGSSAEKHVKWAAIREVCSMYPQIEAPARY